MRTFHIDFLNTENMLPDGDILGNQGEHNATVLTVTPPAEMTGNENITSYRIAFELSNCRAVHSKDIAKADIISLPLFSQITSSETIAVQLEGYDENGDIVVKSEKVKKLKFNPSVCGIEVPPSDSPNSMAAEVTANTAFRKQFIKENTTKTISVSDIVFPQATTDGNGVVLFINDESVLKEGTEIKSIYITYNEKRINIKDIVIFDGKPYVINYNKVVYSTYHSFFVLATLWSPEQSEIIESFINYQTFNMEIEYYT